jgi:hypothetical protein
MSTNLPQRLRNLVALNEPEHGGPYQGTAAFACVEAMKEAAEALDQPTTPTFDDAEIAAIVKSLSITVDVTLRRLPRLRGRQYDEARADYVACDAALTKARNAQRARLLGVTP